MNRVSHLLQLPHRIPHSPNRNIVMKNQLVYNVRMHGEWVSKVEGAALFMQQIKESIRKIRRRVDTQDLAALLSVPASEEGRLEPFVVLLPRRVLRAILVGVYRLADHLEQEPEPSCWGVLSTGWFSAGEEKDNITHNSLPLACCHRSLACSRNTHSARNRLS